MWARVVASLSVLVPLQRMCEYVFSYSAFIALDRILLLRCAVPDRVPNRRRGQASKASCDQPPHVTGMTAPHGDSFTLHPQAQHLNRLDHQTEVLSTQPGMVTGVRKQPNHQRKAPGGSSKTRPSTPVEAHQREVMSVFAIHQFSTENSLNISVTVDSSSVF